VWLDELKTFDCVGCLCDKRAPVRQKLKFYRSLVRPAMMYGLKCWVVDRRTEQNMRVAEMKMLFWIIEVTIEDRKRNDHVLV